MAITPLPPAPQITDDTATFNARAFAWVDSIDGFTTEANALAVQANTDAGTATTQAGIATSAAGTATTKAGEASDDADAAAASALEAAGLVENYQGALGSDPALNKDGGALVAGDWYINTSTGLIRAYDGASWVNALNVTAGVTSVNGSTGDVTLGTLSGQDADDVAITGGDIDGTEIGGTTPAAGTFTTVDDQFGEVRTVPQSGSAKTASYTLLAADNGQFIEIGTGGSITIPDATFAAGDIISFFNNTSGDITITCTITTAYIAGTDEDKATVTLATRGLATILFISGTVCVMGGNLT
jgi:hypothetical protein